MTIKLKIWWSLLFRNRRTTIVVLAFAVISGLYVSQNYYFDASATRLIQDQASGWSYDFGVNVTCADAASAGSTIAAAEGTGLVATAVNFTIINLPHANFTSASVIPGDFLQGNEASDALPQAALLWVNLTALQSSLTGEFTGTALDQPGIYLQSAIGPAFHLPAAGPFNFSFGAYFDSINQSAALSSQNYTALVQDLPCRGYFDFATNTTSDFQAIIAETGIPYFILVAWGSGLPDPVGLPLPAYYVGTQECAFFVKMNVAALNSENLAGKITQYHSFMDEFTINNYYCLLFENVDNYGTIAGQVISAEEDAILKIIPFFIIACIFIWWVFSSTKETRLEPVVTKLARGESRRNLLGIFALAEFALALLGAALANGLGILVGFVAFSLASGGSPFFLSPSLVLSSFLTVVILDLVLAVIFALPPILKLRKVERFANNSRFVPLKGGELKVRAWQVLACAGIFTWVFASLLPPSMNSPQDPLSYIIAINEVHPSIFTPFLPFLLALGVMWLLVVGISRLQARSRKPSASVQKAVQVGLQKPISPPRRTLTLLLLVGITSAALLSSWASADSIQAQVNEEAFAWVGGSFSVSDNSGTPLQQFSALCGNIVQVAQAAGFQGASETIPSTLVTIGSSLGDYYLDFIDPSYYANLFQLTSDFFDMPSSPEANLNSLQENCTLLPYEFHDSGGLEVNDTISVQVIRDGEYNGTGTTITLKVVGFYYAFPLGGGSNEANILVCSKQTLQYFPNQTLFTTVLFNSAKDVTPVVAALNATYGYETTVTTFQGELSAMQASYSLESGMAQYFNWMFAGLLFGEIAIAFATILQGDQLYLQLRRLRGEAAGKLASEHARGDAILLLTSIGASGLLALLAAVMSIILLNIFLLQGSGAILYQTYSIPYPLVFPWGEYGLLALALAATWGGILALFFARFRRAPARVGQRMW
jgi:hypothetical protein